MRRPCASTQISPMADHPFHNPFAALKPLRDTMPEPQAPAEPPPAPPDPPASTPRVARAVVRLERSGRSGKEVTVIDHLNLEAQDLERWLKALKASLGCGGAIEGASIVLQGDHRKRLPGLLTARGVKKISS
ncbi:MAG: translation initiation factor SUI1 [Acidobacteria bacterium SCN 69-37]|nr:MAG: translation initiation factor SUI1 [Acidobacteria bacterium SCN 69-37]